MSENPEYLSNRPGMFDHAAELIRPAEHLRIMIACTQRASIRSLVGMHIVGVVCTAAPSQFITIWRRNNDLGNLARTTHPDADAKHDKCGAARRAVIGMRKETVERMRPTLMRFSATKIP
jgi:hypothetical protein